MKRTAAAIFLSALSLTLVNAQKEYRKSVALFSTGISVPYKEFAAKKMEGYSGFASPGANIDIDFFRHIGKYVGFCSNFGYANMPFSERAYESGYDELIPDIGGISVSAGNYQFMKGLLGFTLRIPETNRTEVILQLQLGGCLCIHPGITVTSSELGVINSIENDTDWEPASSSNIRVNYYISDRYGISLSYGRNSARPYFNDKTSVEGGFFLPVKYQTINIAVVIKLEPKE